MRVIAGSARGVRLRVPRGLRVRPTGARLRTSLFSILGERVGGARVADLFAGSGAFGIEALSRGAAFCCFVEALPVAVQAIRANLEATRLAERAAVIRGDAFRTLDRLAECGPFDLVFLDPPYRYFTRPGRLLELLEALGGSSYLADEGLVVVQHDKRTTLPERVRVLSRCDLRNYGNTSVTFLARTLS